MSALAIAKHPTGLDLRLRRVAAGVTQTRIAEEAGVSRQAVTYWESQWRPTARAINLYLSALERAAER